MSGTITIRSVMSNYPYSIEIGAHANSAKTMLQQMKIHHLPVMENGAPVGIITSHDIKKAEYTGMDVTIGSEVLVRDLYTRSTHIVTPDEPLEKVLHYMAEQHIDATIVLENDKLVGIFTATDACLRYADLLKHSPEAIENHDNEIDREFLG